MAFNRHACILTEDHRSFYVLSNVQTWKTTVGIRYGWVIISHINLFTSLRIHDLIEIFKYDFPTGITGFTEFVYSLIFRLKQGPPR